MWANILTKPLKYKSFREFIVELINFPVDYENGKSVCEYVVNNTGFSKTNKCTHTGGTNTCSISYAESTRSIIKFPMASLQELVGWTPNPGVPGRSRRMLSTRIMGVSNLMAVRVSVWN